MPYSQTILRATWVAFSMSLEAPVVGSRYHSSSATRPPSSMASSSIISFLVTRSEMIDELAMLLGGRVAEELWFLDPTTGASNDIEKATQVARKMVCEYGMSDRLGSLV